MSNQPKLPTEYVYSSSELSQFYGITIKGMEFYEDKGIVHPQRVGAGKKRRFTLADSYRLYYVRLLKNSGVGLPETIKLLEHNTIDQLEEQMGEHIGEMRRQLRFRQRSLECWEHTFCMLRLAADEEPFCETIHSDGFYRLFLRRFTGPHESNCEETLEYRGWNDLLPITAASLRFPLEDCLQAEGSIDTCIGLMITEKDFADFGCRESERTQHIPAGRFVHGIIRGDAERLCDRRWLQPMLDTVHSEGLTQIGDVFTRLISITSDGDQTVRSDEVWIPVAEEQG